MFRIGYTPDEMTNCFDLFAFPTGINMQMKVKDILSGRRFIRLSQVYSITLQRLFDSPRNPDRLLHHTSTYIIAHGIDIWNMLFWDYQRMIFQREEDDNLVVFVNDVC